ncbi:hypothetical protein Tco_1111874 [Tanacetum coccineum]|uniref:Uncharacterized protein n=1 Tax=Tanacetum coccineum TaxID=301880 RepID=A0ABQ5IP55_9ASTR
MTTPRTPVTSHARIFIPFIILPDSKDADTTLPVRSAPLPPLPLFEEMEHDIGIPQDDIGLSQQEIVALRARVATLKQQDRVTRDSLRIARGKITRLQLRAVAAEQAEAAEQRAKALQISLGAAQIDIIDFLDSRRADRLEMAKL